MLAHPAPPPVQRVIVGVGECHVSGHPAVTLSSYSLGSCLALVAWDPVTGGGGLLHVMLPHSRVSPGKAGAQPAMFVDTALPLFFRMLATLPSPPQRPRLFLAGGASVLCTNDVYRIGEKNIAAVTDHLAKIGYELRGRAVGGPLSRTIHFQVGTGEITLKAGPDTEHVHLAA